MKIFHRWKCRYCVFLDVFHNCNTHCRIEMERAGITSDKNRAKVRKNRKKNLKKTQLRRMQASCQCKNLQKFDVLQKVNRKKRLNLVYALRQKGDA